MDYLPSFEEWNSWIRLQWIKIHTNQINDTQDLIIDHSYLYNIFNKKIKMCIDFTKNNYWINNEHRSECIICAIHSIDNIIKEPTYDQLNNIVFKYTCCLTNENASWNTLYNTSSCIRIQFLFKSKTPSIYFTISRSMILFLTSLSYLYNIEQHLNDEYNKHIGDIPEEFTSSTNVVFDRIYNSMKYVYMVVYKYTIPPTITEVEQILEDRKVNKRKIKTTKRCNKKKKNKTH